LRKQLTIHAATPYGDGNTVIVDEDGNTIDHVTEATIFMRANDMTEVDLVTRGSLLNIKGFLHEVQFKCPACRFEVTHTCEGDRGDSSSSHPTALPPIQSQGGT
jgi:hypothetical protein